MEPIYSDHSRLDARSVALHRLVAEKVLADPALLDQARGNVRRWQESHGSPSLALAEWEQILTGTPDQVARFLVARSEKATRLRQSSPFTGILTKPERLAIYRIALNSNISSGPPVKSRVMPRSSSSAVRPFTRSP